MKRPKSEYAIQTVQNAIRVLRAFGDHDELGVTDLARHLGLHKNNVFRLLATLEEEGMVEQAPGSDRYRLGVGCREIGRFYVRGNALVTEAAPALESLAEQTGETVHLARLHRHAVVHLHGLPSSQLVSTAVRVGEPLPAHCTALGKVLLACGATAVQERFDREVVSPHGLEARTPATITDREKLFEHLRSVASQGFALDLEECAPGLHCAAAPILDGEGEVAGALSVSGPAFRMPLGQMMRDVVPPLVAAAEGVSRRL